MLNSITRKILVCDMESYNENTYVIRNIMFIFRN